MVIFLIIKLLYKRTWSLTRSPIEFEEVQVILILLCTGFKWTVFLFIIIMFGFDDNCLWLFL